MDEADERTRLEAVSVIQQGIFGAVALKERQHPLCYSKTANIYTFTMLAA